jgi:hypothetical protein
MNGSHVDLSLLRRDLKKKKKGKKKKKVGGGARSRLFREIFDLRENPAGFILLSGI